jgi:2-dehydropantoate 2-reductase
MRIGIIGGGSIGLLFAYYLSQLYEVTLYTKTIEQAEAIEENGIHLICNTKTHKGSVKSEWFEKWSGVEELTIIAVKQYHLNKVIERIIERQSKNTDFIFLQNGMGHLKFLNKLYTNNIYIGSVEHGAYKKNLYTVLHNGIGETKLALYKGNMSLPSSISSIPNFSICFELDYLEMLLKKLVVNAIINPLTALLDVTNGELINNEHYSSAAKDLFIEIAEVLTLENRETYFQQVVEVCRRTSENRSSMLKDLESNRPTEIDAIIGYILEEAEKKNIKAPISRMLYFCIKGSER